MTTKAATPFPPAAPTDPWAEARAPWIPAPGTRAERAKAQQFQKPRLWEHIRPDDRGLIAQLAAEVLDVEPAVHYAFAARLVERLRARRAAATSEGEQARLHSLDVLVSRRLADLSDLLTRVQSLPAEAPR